MLRPSPNHGTQRLPNDDDEMMMNSFCTSLLCNFFTSISTVENRRKVDDHQADATVAN